MIRRTWREFVETADFGSWEIGAGKVEGVELPEYIIEKYTEKDILKQPDVEYDEYQHLIDWGILIEIKNWNESIKFYIVYQLNIETNTYEAYGRPFFSKREAKEFIKYKIKKERLEEIENFLYENKEKIWTLAVKGTTPISDSIVWLDNVEEGELKLTVGTYTTGTFENPKNVENSIEVYSLNRNWDSNIPYEELCWEIEEDENGNEIIYRTPEHYLYDRKRPLSEKEQWEDLYDVGYIYFEEEFDIDKILDDIKEKFGFEKEI